MWCVVCVFLFNMGDSFLCLYDIKKQLKRQNIPGRKKKKNNRDREERVAEEAWTNKRINLQQGEKYLVLCNRRE